MRAFRAIVLAATLAPWAAAATGAEYTVEPLKEGPPEGLPAAFQAEMGDQGYRVLDEAGKPYAEVWLRKAVPAKGAPSGPEGAVLYPVLAEGELIGALRYPGEGYDYRDQAIAPGAYTLRYGLRPVDGNHQGVSTYKDFALLVPPNLEESLEPLTHKTLEKKSAEAAGTSHPAVLLLQPPPEGDTAAGPTVVHDQMLDTWGVVLPVSLKVEGQSEPVTMPMHLVVVGVAAP